MTARNAFVVSTLARRENFTDREREMARMRQAFEEPGAKASQSACSATDDRLCRSAFHRSRESMLARAADYAVLPGEASMVRSLFGFDDRWKTLNSSG